jgi:hypothetical protein
MLLEGNKAGDAEEQSISILTTLAHGFAAAPPPPPLCTQVFRHAAGSEELQQLLPSRPISTHVPDVDGKP